MIDVGDPLPIQTMEVRDSAGVLANAGAMTLTVTLPDGTTASPGFTNTVTGVYVPGTYITTQAGRHVIRWVGTGINASAYTEPFDVQPADPGGILSFADAKAYLGETGTSQDEEIRTYAQAASDVVESIVGPVSPRTFTREVAASAGGDVILLPHRPVISVTSITSVWGAAPTWVTADLQVNKVTGAVRLVSRGTFYGGPFTAVYIAGQTPAPPRYVHAARVMLRELWRNQRAQTVDSPMPDFGDELGVGAPFIPNVAIPPEVYQLLSNRVPGIA